MGDACALASLANLQRVNRNDILYVPCFASHCFPLHLLLSNNGRKKNLNNPPSADRSHGKASMAVRDARRMAGGLEYCAFQTTGPELMPLLVSYTF